MVTFTSPLNRIPKDEAIQRISDNLGIKSLELRKLQDQFEAAAKSQKSVLRLKIKTLRWYIKFWNGNLKQIKASPDTEFAWSDKLEW